MQHYVREHTSATSRVEKNRKICQKLTGTRTYENHRSLRPTGFDINRTLRSAARTLQASTLRLRATEDKLTASKSETAGP